MNRRDFLKGVAILPSGHMGVSGQIASKGSRPTKTTQGNRPLNQVSQSDPRVVPDSGWPMYQGDARNTGFDQQQIGPIESPSRKWQFRSKDSPGSSLAVANGIAVFGDIAGNVYALNTETGEELWRFETVGEMESTGPAMTKELVIAGSSGGTVYALDLQNGQERWRFEAGGSRLAPAPLTIANGVVYVSGEKLYALNAGTGEKKWSSDFKPSPNFPLAATSFRIYVATFNKVIALKPADGRRVWEFTPEGKPTGVSFADGTVYFGDDANTVYALEGTSGKEQWRFKTDDTAEIPAVAGDTIFVASNQAGIYAINIEDGTERWRFDIPNDGLAQTPPLVTEQTVYVTPSDNQYTYALSSDDGSRYWRMETGQSWDPMALANGELYIQSSLGMIVLTTDPDRETSDTEGQTSTEATDSEDQTTGKATDSTANTPTGDTGGTPKGDTGNRKRGFFSNSGSEPEFLSNVFNLTVLGFLLSVVGILHQMLQGR